MKYSPNIISRPYHLRSRGSLRIASMLALLMLSACSDVLPALRIQTVTPNLKQPTKQSLPNPEPILTLPIKWQVITKNNLPQEDNWVLYAITPQGYENLVRMQADTTRWVLEASYRMDYCREPGNVK